MCRKGLDWCLLAVQNATTTSMYYSTITNLNCVSVELRTEAISRPPTLYLLSGLMRHTPTPLSLPV